MSHAALIWVDDVVEGVDVTSRAMLSKLAGVSDDDDCAWMRVCDLAKRVGASERTIQSRLRWLVEKGLLLETGRMHRLGTRSVPIYELAVDHVGVAQVLSARKGRRDSEAQTRAAMGATVCTHSPAPDDTVCTRMGATVCTPNEDNRGKGESNDSPTGVGAREASEGQGPGVAVSGENRLFEDLLADWRAAEARAGVSRTREDQVQAAWDRAVAQVPAAALAAAARRALAEDKDFRRAGHLVPGLHRWLDSGRFSGWLTPGSAAGSPSGAVGAGLGGWPAPPPELRASFVETFGAAKAASYFPGGWREADRAVIARTNTGFSWLRDNAGGWLADNTLTLTTLADAGQGASE